MARYWDTIKPMKTLILFALLFVTGCFASTVPDAPPSPVCPAVECAWTNENTCPTGTFVHESVATDIDDGATTCWVYTAACVTHSVDMACVPESCKQNQFATCAPKANP